MIPVIIPYYKHKEKLDKCVVHLKKQTIEADTIVPAMPLAPNTELLKTLKGKVPEIYSIGDCREPHLIVEAIAEGASVAVKL